jgi:hypothetical protein
MSLKKLPSEQNKAIDNQNLSCIPLNTEIASSNVQLPPISISCHVDRSSYVSEQSVQPALDPHC